MNVFGTICDSGKTALYKNLAEDPPAESNGGIFDDLLWFRAPGGTQSRNPTCLCKSVEAFCFIRWEVDF